VESGKGRRKRGKEVNIMERGGGIGRIIVVILIGMIKVGFID
jgi:hypothetical protein